MQAGDLHSPGVGFWSFADNGLKMVRRNDKARSERALSERFERGLETTIYLYGASGGIRTHDPPSEANAVQKSWLATSVQKCL